MMRTMPFAEVGTFMMAVFQAGFWKDYVAAIVITVVLGASVAAGIAFGLDAIFGQALGELLGAPDEPGLLVHVRAESEQAAAAQIIDLLAAHGDDITVRQGVTVAGNANFLITLPKRLLDGALLEQIHETLKQLSGYNGHTWLLEPSVAVSGMRPAVRDAVAQYARNIPGVQAVVRQGTSLTILLEEEEQRQRVTERLNEWFATHLFAEIYVGDEQNGAERVLAAIDETLHPDEWKRLQPVGGTGDERLDELIALIERLPDAWQQLSRAGEATADTLQGLVALLDGLQPALALADGPEQHADRIVRALREGDPANAVKDVLLNVATSMLLQSLTNNVAKAAPTDAHKDEVVPKSDREEKSLAGEQLLKLRTSLEELAHNVDALSSLPEADLQKTVATLQQLLPSVAADTPGRVELLVDARVSQHMLEQVVKEGLGEHDSGARLFMSVPGVVNPNPRAILTALLGDVRRTIAGLLALLIALLALAFDHATIFAASERLDVSQGAARSLAAAVGAVLFGAIYSLAGGGLPLPEPLSAGAVGIVAVVGAFAGLLTKRLSSRISPADEAEILAGRSLGLTEGHVLREIVVPSGRPGMLLFINKHRRRFR